MFSKFITDFMSTGILVAAIEILLPIMCVAFVLSISLRFLIWYTVRRHDWFAQEFEKRVNKFIEAEVPGVRQNTSFFVLSKRLLEKTYYEAFEVRDRLKRRRGDTVMAMNDRIFLVKHGCAWLVKDILKQVKFLRWHDNNPKLINITKNTLQQNPCFNRLFGLVPLSDLNDILNILPGLFVIGGIFGTFMGIVNGLPKLGGMNLQDVETSKQVMDAFLFEVSFAMNSSIIGILFSVLTTITNTIWSPEKVFAQMVDRFESSLDLIWYRSDNNEYPKADNQAPADPSELLASEALASETKDTVRSRELTDVIKRKTS